MQAPGLPANIGLGLPWTSLLQKSVNYGRKKFLIQAQENSQKPQEHMNWVQKLNRTPRACLIKLLTFSKRGTSVISHKLKCEYCPIYLWVCQGGSTREGSSLTSRYQGYLIRGRSLGQKVMLSSSFRNDQHCKRLRHACQYKICFPV